MIGDGQPLAPPIELVADGVVAAGPATHCKDLHVLHRDHMSGKFQQTGLSLLQQTLLSFAQLWPAFNLLDVSSAGAWLF